MGPGVDPRRGPLSVGSSRAVCCLPFAFSTSLLRPLAGVSSFREALQQYAGRTWSGFSFTGSGGIPGSAPARQASVPRRSDARFGLPSAHTAALGGTGTALINNVYAQNDLGRLQSKMHKLK